MSLWTFKSDRAGSGTWNEVIDTNSPVWDSLTRPHYPLQAYGSNKAWILGGDTWLNPSWKPLGENLIEFDMEARTFKNSSVQCCKADKGIVAGSMHFVTSFGPQGLIVALGGDSGVHVLDSSSYNVLDFVTVSVFDPARQEWWNQTTTGSAPSPRWDFCTAGINSTNGTYEMYGFLAWAFRM